MLNDDEILLGSDEMCLYSNKDINVFKYIAIALFSPTIFLLALGIYSSLKPVKAEVLKEYGTVVKNERKLEDNIDTSYEFQNETYSIKLKTDDRKIYTFDIYEGNGKTLDNLNLEINNGTNIRISRFNFDRNIKGNIGSIYTDEIEVLKEE